MIASCTRSGNRKPFPGNGTCLAPGMEATVKRVLKAVLVLAGALFVVSRTETSRIGGAADSTSMSEGTMTNTAITRARS